MKKESLKDSIFFIAIVSPTIRKHIYVNTGLMVLEELIEMKFRLAVFFGKL
ncbi:hypothetical protein ACNKXS_08960 [Christiangramia marina]|uniref:hypothetical protein n=1 Tax=Christiangramia marina TaxID=409436 RepID=UPI003AA7F791